MFETRTFRVHALHDGCDHAHGVDAETFEEAAVAFMEAWHPEVDSYGQASVVVRDVETGVEHCFRVDFESGETSACQ
ncbi:hypothetical protein SGCZBJ_10565 [Caulobacter zeae]|jgi:hypothetical protein|uniref:Uncharacterized protein n=2 Tax=Caulobacter TaxID=75 RepID=A0A2T9JP39_9CAUL|nr:MULTISPECIES: DUF5961 family protein [Caulobacter]PLR25658.1 hypothetical protein SGCZBJ_10565 [Caulobacter zeae]PVM77640.1 hypothetical protein DDF65_17120 [Caulobacter radicis]PVM85381.1 hypothetical protein DDF62_20190 [Caulobacter radicis]